MVFDTPEFSQTGNKVLELTLKFLNSGLVKLWVVVQNLGCSFGLGICRVG